MTGFDVIVGVDGSAASRAALRWAAAEALRRTARLRIISTYRTRWLDSTFPADTSADPARDDADVVVAAAVADARAHAPGVPVIGSVVRGGAAETLLAAAGPADLIAVGSHGHSGFASALVGSTSQQIALHAPVSVAVVRGRGDTAAGPVAVGVDGSASGDRALAVAFAAAAARGCGLTLVRAFAGAPVWPADVPRPAVFSAESTREALLDELTRAAKAWVDKYPAVPVERLMAPGDAADVLVAVSRGAQLVVVGSRGHGGFAGLLLGSVGMHLIHHADCPVLIAR